MLRRPILLPLLLLFLAACGGDKLTTPVQPSAAGSWSGTAAGTTFSLVLTEATDGGLSGSGTLSHAVRTAPVAATGTYTPPDVSLTLTPEGFVAITFQGHLSGDAIEGTLNGSGFSSTSLTLVRQ